MLEFRRRRLLRKRAGPNRRRNSLKHERRMSLKPGGRNYQGEAAMGCGDAVAGAADAGGAGARREPPWQRHPGKRP